MAKNDIEHSQVRASMEFPPPSVFNNPWEDLGTSSTMYGVPPPFDDEDFDGHQGSDEDDMPAVDTPTDDGGKGDDDDDDE